ncbi:MAG: hypothetical protein GX852_05315 [Clostridiales bacterium]|jgi:hypothetical protein|nr:hypothetical protein [Clostridiales bacterium]
MNKIKDFFHNSNDIILALVIIMLAVGVIFWRLTVILDYPKSQAATSVIQDDTESSK